MTKRLGRKQSGIMVLLLSLMVVTGVAGPASADVFTSYKGGDWDDVCTWFQCPGSPPVPPPGARVPGPGDTANVEDSVTFNRNIEVDYLNPWVNGTLTGSAATTGFTIQYGGTWSGGRLAAGVFEIRNGAILNIVENLNPQGAEPAKYLGFGETGVTLTNQIGAQINQAGTLTLINKALIENKGVYSITADKNVESGNSNNYEQFIVNTGTFQKTGGAGESKVFANMVVDNQGGIIGVSSGTLILGRLVGTGGTFNVTNGGVLEINGTGGAIVSGGPTDTTFTGTYTGPDNGGTVKFYRPGAEASLRGNATFNFPGNVLQWESGKIYDTFTNDGNLGIADTASSRQIGSTSATGGTLVNNTTGTINQSGNIQFLNTATLVNKGTYSITNDSDITAANVDVQTITNTGTFRKTGGAGVEGSKVFSNITFDNQGTVEVLSGTLTIGKAAQLSGTSTTLTGGTWNVVGDSTLVISSGSASGIKTNQGSVTLSGANSTFAKINALETITNEGSFTIKNGRNFTTAGNLTNAGALAVGAGSTLWIDEGGTGTFTNTGTVSGSGSIIGSFVNNGGTISPGSSPGSLTIDGNYSQTGGALDFEIQNTNPGFFDQLFVKGNASITDSTFNISLWPGYDIKNNDTFTLIDANGTLTITNPTFTGLDPAGPVSFTWELDGSNNDLLLIAHVTTSVPEPATLLLLLGGLLPLGIAGRRKGRG